jgi:hypothetical protein
MKINLRLRSAQSTITICASEAWVPKRGNVRRTLGAGMVIMPWNVAFTVEVRPLDLAWEAVSARQDTGMTLSALLTIVVGI